MTRQTHRKLLGLVCVGECSSVQDVSELYKIHDSLRAKYSNTLYDSRCIFLGMQSDGMNYSNVTLYKNPCCDIFFICIRYTPKIRAVIKCFKFILRRRNKYVSFLSTFSKLFIKASSVLRTGSK